MSSIRIRVCLAAAFAMGIPAAAAAQDSAGQTSDDRLEELIVWGRALQQIGTAYAANEGTVGYADLSRRPLLRVGELAEAVPGLIATQHSGGGKANQYFLRGFNLDHGTDFTVLFDGVPVNMRSHAHAQGYLDMNFIIPELVERIDYAKGVYRADTGDFSAAGSARFTTYDRLETPRIEATIGEDDYYRAVAAGSTDIGSDTTLLAAGEAFYNNGPWSLAQNLERYKGFLKLTHNGSDFTTRVSLQAFTSTWYGTDQIPKRAVESGDISRFGFIDDDPGGKTGRYALTVSAESEDVSLRAYALRYHLNLFSNSTYFLNHPDRGDEIEQADRRWILGAKAEKTWQTRIADRFVDFRAGVDLRGDFAGRVALFNTEDRARWNTVRDDEVRDYSIELWGETEAYLTESLRIMLGLRGSYYRGVVNALRPANSGTADDALLQPKASIAWQANDHLELYASAGRGFHSNDVRGAVNSVDPVSGAPATPVPLLVKANGYEAGVRFDPTNRIRTTLTAFLLDLGSELVFVGDAGTSEPSAATRRYGVEGTVFWDATDWLTLDAQAALTHARFRLNADAPDRVPQSIPFMLGGGAVFDLAENVGLSFRVRHFSGTPLVEDNSVRSDPTTLVNGQLSWRLDRVTAKIGVFNIFDAKDADISYYFASQLADEPEPVEDIHFHPVEPRQVRLTLGVRF